MNVYNKKNINPTRIYKTYKINLINVPTVCDHVCIVLLLRGGLGFTGGVVTSLIAAEVPTFVELCKKDGYKTFTCFAVAMLIILPMIHLFGG